MRVCALLLVMVAALPGFGLLFGMDKNDVEYSRPNGKPLLLDIHVPDGPGPFPAAIVVHGGGFDQGTKRSYVPPLLEVLTKVNYAWFSIDYRLAPEAKFPQPVEDVDAAIRWVKKNAAAWHVDPAKLSAVELPGSGGASPGSSGTF